MAKSNFPALIPLIPLSRVPQHQPNCLDLNRGRGAYQIKTIKLSNRQFLWFGSFSALQDKCDFIKFGLLTAAAEPELNEKVFSKVVDAYERRAYSDLKGRETWESRPRLLY